MSTPLRLGLIGAGRWGRVYIRTLEGLAPRLRLTHLATRRPENRALVNGPVELFSDWRELVNSSCDAVVIAAPAPLHAEMTRACLEARKPCIVEKPLCFDTATAQSLRQQAEEAGLPVLVNYIHLYNPAYQALKRAFEAAGNPVRAILSEGMDLGPFRADTGTLWDRLPHDVALCLDWMGGIPAFGGTFLDKRVKRGGSCSGMDACAFGGLPDSHGRPEMLTLRLRWTSGATAWIQSGRLSPQKRRTFSVFTDSELFHFDDEAPIRCAEARGGASSKLLSREVPPEGGASASAGRCRRLRFDYAGRERDIPGNVPFPDRWEPIAVPDSGPTPMEAMLTSFADGLEGKGDIPHLGLTVELTRILEECQAQLQQCS